MTTSWPTMRREVEITNRLGLHLRPADRFVALAQQFTARVLVCFEGKQTDGKSILDVTTLGAGPGAWITIEAHGPDAQEAVEALSALVESGFDEPEDDLSSDNGVSRSSDH